MTTTAHTPSRRTGQVAARAVLALCLGAGLTLAAAGPAGAATTGTTPTPDGELLQQRLQVACARVPALITRTENLGARLAGDAATIGSLAWLQEQADRADEQDRDELADVLTARLQVRQALADLLPERLEALQAAEEYCAGTGS